MKIKFWSFEYEFDNDDAKIVVPIILLLVAVVKTFIDPAILVAIAVIYYLAYFFWENLVGRVFGLIAKARFRCPECKNRKIILQGYQGYHSDEHYPYYLCTHCGTTSILTDGRLLKIGGQARP